MKIYIFLVLSTMLFIACDRNTENVQGYREEQEEVTAPNDYTSGEDTKERRQTGTKDRLPINNED